MPIKSRAFSLWDNFLSLLFCYSVLSSEDNVYWNKAVFCWFFFWFCDLLVFYNQKTFACLTFHSLNIFIVLMKQMIIVTEFSETYFSVVSISHPCYIVLPCIKDKTTMFSGCPCGVIVKVMDCRIVESEFELQLHYYIHFWSNTLGKGVNPFIPIPAMG